MNDVIQVGSGSQDQVARPIRHLLRFNDENAWSDLLATLIEWDPEVAASTFGYGGAGETMVRRELARGQDRSDLVIERHGKDVGLIEAKLLATLGPRQLARYEETWRHIPVRILLVPESLMVQGGRTGWSFTTWETTLAAFANSKRSIVSKLAGEWKRYLAASMPKVDAATRWGDLSIDKNEAYREIRYRCAWISRQLRLPSGMKMEVDLSVSGLPILYAWTPVRMGGYYLHIELEESRDRRVFPPSNGPHGIVMLAAKDLVTSGDYDWSKLIALGPRFASVPFLWKTRGGSLKSAIDRDAAKKAGARKWLTYGFGERQRIKRGWCGFGPRWQLPLTSSLQEVADQMQESLDLASRLRRYL